MKFHLSNVYRKLGVSNRTRASRVAEQHEPALDRRPGRRRLTHTFGGRGATRVPTTEGQMEGSVRERPAEAPPRTTRLSQYWHPIAESSQLTDQPRPFTLLDEKLVAFRTDEGVSVFKDLCVHRGAALSLGWVRNGCIVCPYHGWEYDQHRRLRAHPGARRGQLDPGPRPRRRLPRRGALRPRLGRARGSGRADSRLPAERARGPVLRGRDLLGADVGHVGRPLDRELDGRLALPVRPRQHPRRPGLPAAGAVRAARDGVGAALPGQRPVLPQRRRDVRDPRRLRVLPLVPVLRCTSGSSRTRTA